MKNYFVAVLFLCPVFSNAQVVKAESSVGELVKLLEKEGIWLNAPNSRKCPKGFVLDMSAVKHPSEMYGCSANYKSNPIRLLSFDTQGKGKIRKINFDIAKEKFKCDVSTGSSLIGDKSLKPNPNKSFPGFQFFFKTSDAEGSLFCGADLDLILGTFWIN